MTSLVPEGTRLICDCEDHSLGSTFCILESGGVEVQHGNEANEDCFRSISDVIAILFESSLFLQVSEDPKMFLVDTPG